MIDTQKRNNRQYKWQKENKERVNFLMEKGTKARIEAASEAKGIKPSEFIRNAIEKSLKDAGF